MPTVSLFTPWRRERTVELGNHRWRKQLLPLGTVVYNGERIDFSRGYLRGLVRAFSDRAVDAVPFQLAGDNNKHTNAVKQRAGTIRGLELVDDGLDLILETDDEGDKLLSKYPDIGVSARIYEDYTRESDGRHWPAALQHVLATLDPHIVGMRQWTKLEPELAMSNSHSRVIDLTNEKFEGEGKEERVPKTRGSLKEILAKLESDGDETELTDEELDRLLAIVNAAGEDDSESELSDEELEAILAAAEAEGDDTEDDATSSDPAVIAAANRSSRALELANARLEHQALELAGVQKRLDTSEWEREKRELATKYGIPPSISEKGRALLFGSGHVVELSNGEEVDAGGILRDVLHAIGDRVKILDLSGLIGSDLQEPDTEEKQEADRVAAERDDFLTSVKTAFRF